MKVEQTVMQFRPELASFYAMCN